MRLSRCAIAAGELHGNFNAPDLPVVRGLAILIRLFGKGRHQVAEQSDPFSSERSHSLAECAGLESS